MSFCDCLLAYPSTTKSLHPQIAALCQLIERQWYEQRGAVEAALAAASSHDLAAVYKRLLRALPTPLLTQELMRLFYHTYGEFDRWKIT